MTLSKRVHIQNFTSDSTTEPHWGYADRIVPCTNDAGSCEYLDVVYHSHDLGMLYMGIFWASILGLLLVWGIAWRVTTSSSSNASNEAPSSSSSEAAQQPQRLGGIEKLRRAVATFHRRHLLPDFAPRIFGHITRLQVTIFLIMAAYLSILSFVGIVYKTWITPVKNTTPQIYQTRSSIGPFADRVGVLAYALTPLSILLASRESLLAQLTGVPYTAFIFLHRWTGWVILVQSAVHTLGWVIVEAALYKPQPAVWASLVVQPYIQWGFAALGLLVLLVALATPLGVRLSGGYEVFRKAHYVLAMVYIGACIGHWQQLQCFLVPGIVLWGCDRLARGVRTAMLHYHWIEAKGGWGFEAASARAVLFGDDEDARDLVVRLDFEHHTQTWEVGQHFFLCFAEGSVWQSHPMTPLSLPATVDGKANKDGVVLHSYVIRARGGETRRLAEIIKRKMAAAGESSPALSGSASGSGGEDEKHRSRRAAGVITTPVILTGPYGVATTAGLALDANVLCVAGGTGITFVMPVLLQLVREGQGKSVRKIRLVWAVRRDADVKWVGAELDEVKAAGCALGVAVDIYVTREKDHHAPSSSSGNSEAAGCECTDAGHHHPADVAVPAVRRPALGEIVKGFVDGVVSGSTVVYASGPGGMLGDVRRAVAGCNEAGRVWKGDGKGEVRLVCDERLE